MSTTDPTSQITPSTQATLRRLFLTLFLRGRSSRGLKKKTAPKSIGQKLALILTYYFLFGLLALAFSRQSVFVLAAYLHSMTFVFLGMFVASSAGEVLFNREEADILLHRPIDPRDLLWAKVRVLVEVSLWMSCAFNLSGFFVGTWTTDGSWLFLPAHAASMVLESVFCVGCVVMIYQLCLRFFGRERLESLMTSTQVLVAIAAVMSGQILPQLVIGVHHTFNLSAATWWIALVPPAWFAGLDDVIAGSRARGSWVLAALALLATGGVLSAAFGKLSRDYQLGLQTMNESAPKPRRSRGRRRLLDVLIELPPFSWWLRNPVERAAFLLSAAYLMRDRDVKLRVYPAVAPFLALPLVFIMRDHAHGQEEMEGFELAMISTYVGVIPLMAVNVLQYSQQWQACDIFRAAPIAGPGPLCHGGRRAVLLLLATPIVVMILLALIFL
ncbi:MAG TPA: hypothetical protein VL992_08040, partial [Tepidisphaeraceae bacterium]|nr:hypothetical protein [Tepidisphaeraceae bacterium]